MTATGQTYVSSRFRVMPKVRPRRKPKVSINITPTRESIEAAVRKMNRDFGKGYATGGTVTTTGYPRRSSRTTFP
jgi:hypothetical protein